MFGLSKLFEALKRLTSSINRTADLWDSANEQLEERLAIVDAEEVQALPAPKQSGGTAATRNGRKLVSR